MTKREEAVCKVTAVLAKTPLGHGLNAAGFPAGWEGDLGETCALVLREFARGKAKLSTVQWQLLEELLDAVLAVGVPAVRNDVYILSE